MHRRGLRRGLVDRDLRWRQFLLLSRQCMRAFASAAVHLISSRRTRDRTVFELWRLKDLSRQARRVCHPRFDNSRYDIRKYKSIKRYDSQNFNERIILVDLPIRE